MKGIHETENIRGRSLRALLLGVGFIVTSFLTLDISVANPCAEITEANWRQCQQIEGLNVTVSGNAAKAQTVPPAGNIEVLNAVPGAPGGEINQHVENQTRELQGQGVQSLPDVKPLTFNAGEHQINQCESASKSVETWCGTLPPITPAAMAAVHALTAATNSGSLRAQCNAAAGVAALSIGTNLMLAQKCTSAKRTCNEVCGRIENAALSFLDQNVGSYEQRMNSREILGSVRRSMHTCQEDDTMKMVTMLQSMQAAQALTSSVDCYNAVKAEEELQASLKDACEAEETQEAQDACFCRKPENQYLPRCYNGDENSDGSETNRRLYTGVGGSNPFDDMDDGSGDYDEYEYDGNGDVGANSPTSNNGSGGGGGGFSPNAGSAGGSGAGGTQGTGSQKGPYDTDVLQGTTSGSGGGIAAGGGGGSGGRMGGRGYAGTQKEKGLGFDLSKYLPGRQKATKRSIAKVQTTTQISAANGLTNFEKVSRKMNQKRPSLILAP